LILFAGVYLALFLASAGLCLAFTYRVRSSANARGWVAQPESERHIHTISVPRLGGVAIFLAFMLVAGVAFLLPKSAGFGLTIPARTVLAIFASGLIIFLLGLYDDLRVAGPYLKFGVQAVAATVLYFGGVGVNQFDLLSAGRSLHTAVALPLTIFWVLLLTNAFNLIDGLDGLAAGSAFFSTLVVFVSSLLAPNPTVALLAVVLAGAILGFLRFNFHPASIFLGDSGSMFIGFTLAALALAGSQKAPTMIAVAIPVLSFGLPILDVCLAVSRRFLGGKPLFTADRDHIHHKLLKRGLSQRGAVLVLYGVTAAFALLSLIVMHDAALIALVLTIIGLGVAMGVQYLGYPEFSELQEFLKRTSVNKRVVANNVAVRHAVDSLNSCDELVSLLGILKSTLQTVGFDGCRLGSSFGSFYSDEPASNFAQAPGGEIKLFWNEALNMQAVWNLRLSLDSGSLQPLGHLCLLRAAVDRPLLVDINLISGDFAAALSRALVRATDGEGIPVTRLVTSKAVRAAKAATSASD
jgi:UDP-GlcNAc:undecaprenyl-phosphate/decaprenyl-phosphate GlcNAc-1-phosphate transferase